MVSEILEKKVRYFWKDKFIWKCIDVIDKNLLTAIDFFLKFRFEKHAEAIVSRFICIFRLNPNVGDSKKCIVNPTLNVQCDCDVFVHFVSYPYFYECPFC